MEYYTYFELPLNGYWDWSLALPLVMLAFGILFFSYRERFRKPYSNQIGFPLWRSLEKFVYGKGFGYLWIGGVLLFTLVTYSFTYSEYFRARNGVLSGNFDVVEGQVREYEAGTNQRGSAYDTFCVEEVCFEVSDWEVNSGFHQQQVNGSPLKDGVSVRVSYVGDTIVRLEIASEK